MLRSLLITCCLFFCVLHACSQAVFKGRVLENKSRIILSGILVENENNRQSTVTDNKGEFSIEAKTGDLVVFKGFAYQTDTLLLTDLRKRDVFMEPHKNLLNQVNITDTTGRSSTLNPTLNTYYDPQFHGQTVVYSRDANLNYTGGITIRMHYWKKDEHKKAKAALMAKNEQISEHISHLFTVAVLSTYIPLKGDDLDNFILLYIPDVKTYTGAGFNLVTYLNTSYKAYLALPANERRAAQIFKK